MEVGMRGYGGGAKSYDSEKAWSSTNHSIISGYSHLQKGHQTKKRFFVCVPADEAED
jgi:hypothetical protein